MNRTMIEGTLRELKGALESYWAALLKNQRLRVRAEQDRLVGQLQRRYGALKQDAERRLARWTASERRRSHSWRDWQSQP